MRALAPVLPRLRGLLTRQLSSAPPLSEAAIDALFEQARAAKLTQAKQQVSEAERHLKKRPLEAVKLLEDALSLSPGEAGIMSQLGETLHRVGRHEEAVQMMRSALELQPDQVAHSRAMAKILSESPSPNLVDECEIHCEAFIAGGGSSNDPVYLLAQATANGRIGHTKKAMAALEMLLRYQVSDEHEARACSIMGQLLVRSSKIGSTHSMNGMQHLRTGSRSTTTLRHMLRWEHSSSGTVGLMRA